MRRFFQLFYRDLFLNGRLFAALGLCAVLYLLAFFFSWMEVLPSLCFLGLCILVLIDLLLLYRAGAGVYAGRETPERLSNGDDNPIKIWLENRYTFKVRIGVIDEVPMQFQRRDIWFNITLEARGKQTITYVLRPVKRGEYVFGRVLVFVRSPLGLLSRRFAVGSQLTLPVYPSFLQMRRYSLMAISSRLQDMGIKKLRRLGHSMEFEQIKNYVPGDDQRTVNWKATARQGTLMVNNYVDEKAQHVYSVIDKSRVMKMPFNGLSLLDYAINACLALSNVTLLKEDKPGLITLSEKKGAVVPADRRPGQLQRIMEVLYREKTRYLELNSELLYATVRQTMKQRSLILFYTNFESIGAMKRQLPFLKRIARFHLLIVVFFENTELEAMAAGSAKDVEGIYERTVALKFMYDKRLIVKELEREGIQAILTAPENLTVNAINKYLEIKAGQRL